MKKLFAGLLAISTLFAGACAREGVYGYCGAGDTCRYDLPERMLVRTYNGFIEPGSTNFAAVEAPSGAARVDVKPAEKVAAQRTSPVTTPVSAPAVTLVSISN